MNFADLLRQYIGREVEVFIDSSFLEGTLISVGTDSFVVRVRNGTYVEPTRDVTVFISSVQAVRVLATVA
ncbi:hypothetical protein ACWE42_12555 [Sutcliffiella cohnii]